MAQARDALSRSSREGPLQVVWAAGRAGFGASSSECDTELRTFEQYLDWLVGHVRRPDTQFGMKASFDQVLMLMRCGALPRIVNAAARLGCALGALHPAPAWHYRHAAAS